MKNFKPKELFDNNTIALVLFVIMAFLICYLFVAVIFEHWFLILPIVVCSILFMKVVNKNDDEDYEIKCDKPFCKIDVSISNKKDNADGVDR